MSLRSTGNGGMRRGGGMGMGMQCMWQGEGQEKVHEDGGQVDRAVY